MSSTPDVDLLVFPNIGALLNHLSKEITDLERRIKDVEAMLASIKTRADKYKSIVQVIEEIVGKGQQLSLSTAIELTGLKVIFDPRPIDEYEALDEAYRSMMDRLSVLRKVKDVVEIIGKKIGDRSDVPLMVELKLGIPVKIIFRSW